MNNILFNEPRSPLALPKARREVQVRVASPKEKEEEEDFGMCVFNLTLEDVRSLF
ncbi:hypothetical protein [Tolypothrix sp. VBCCA 56010]|uniref:hypothetical protein n=1 Tax=Tolypothrix sp. VBCCA 56010 TaxID=3137731 RepID=UPI003D7D190D